MDFRLTGIVFLLIVLDIDGVGESCGSNKPSSRNISSCFHFGSNKNISLETLKVLWKSASERVLCDFLVDF